MKETIKFLELIDKGAAYEFRHKDIDEFLSLVKVLKEKKGKAFKGILDDLYDNICDGIENFCNDIEDDIYDIINEKAEKPKGRKKYLGIEIEFFTSTSKADILRAIIDMDLCSNITLDSDMSIRTEYYMDEPFEIKILAREDNFQEILASVGKLLKKIKAKVNDSCSVHVHLDMRNRNFKECYYKFINCQKLLFGMVDKSRHDNHFCSYNTDFDYGGRQVAINRHSYNKHRTLEIRLHHGTLDMNKVCNWINLLLLILKTKAKLKDITEPKQLKNIKMTESMKKYLEEFKAPKIYRRGELVG